MAIEIRSKDCLKGLKWSLMPKNSIDTVKGSYITNEALSSLETVASTTIDKVIIGSGYQTLPVTDNGTYQVATSIKNIGTYHNIEGTNFSDVEIECAEGRMAAMFGTISIILKSETPVSGPALVVTLAGNTKKYDHGTATTYADLNTSSISSIFNAVSSKTAVPFSGDSDGQKYSAGNTVLHPFLKENIADNAIVTTDQIWCQWDRNKSGTLGIYEDTAALSSRWNYYGVTGAVRAHGSITYNTLYYSKNVHAIVQKFIQIDHYTFQVDLKVPVKVIGGAKARGIRHWDYNDPQTGYYNVYAATDLIDAFAFRDLLESITVEVKGYTVDADKIEFANSLDENKELTTELVNEKVFQFIDNELVTSKVTWNNVDWLSAMPKFILEKYESGKYQIEFDMYIANAVAKGIGINSELKIYQLNNSTVRRYHRTVLFRVKTMEYQIDNRGFVVRIKAIEEDTAALDDAKVALIYRRSYNNSFGERFNVCLIERDDSTPKLFLINESDLMAYLHFCYRYGNSVSLTSTTTRVESNFLLPGPNIGSRIVLVLWAYDVNNSMDFQLGLVDSSANIFIDTECVKRKVPGTTNDYFWIGIVDVGTHKSNLTLFVRAEKVGVGNIAVNIYNALDFYMTRDEMLDYIIANHLDPHPSYGYITKRFS